MKRKLMLKWVSGGFVTGVMATLLVMNLGIAWKNHLIREKARALVQEVRMIESAAEQYAIENGLT